MPKSAFTLIETVIGVAIISLIASMINPNILRARISANDALAQSTLKAIAESLENYAATAGQYPPSTSSLILSTPPYLNKDYFSDTQRGFTYSANLSAYDYTITATPVTVARTGSTTFTIQTGGVFLP